MKLYNKSGPSLIIDVKYVIDGGRFSEHCTAQDRKYFDIESTIEVTDEYGKQLLKMYPKGLMQTDKIGVVSNPSKKKAVAKKKKVAKRKK